VGKTGDKPLDTDLLDGQLPAAAGHGLAVLEQDDVDPVASDRRRDGEVDAGAEEAPVDEVDPGGVLGIEAFSLLQADDGAGEIPTARRGDWQAAKAGARRPQDAGAGDARQVTA
jgi:hypothetical protein